MTWKSRYATLRRVGAGQVLLARLWILMKADARLRSRYRVAPGDVVVDVGAFEGEFAADMRSRWNAAVIAVEPIPEFAAMVEDRFEGDPSVSVLPVALGKEDGTTSVALADDGSSAWIEGPDAVRVPMRDVSSVVGDLEIALFKINAEGAEFDVLARLIQTGQINQIKCLQVQFHRFVPGAVRMRAEIRHRLKDTHRCSWNVPWVWEQWVIR